MRRLLTLVRVQLKILRWPLGALTVGLLLYLMLSALFPSRHVLVDIVHGLLSMMAVLIVLLSGPILFGVEYQEGAQEYLRSRPVSADSILSAKGVTLILVCLLCAFPFSVPWGGPWFFTGWSLLEWLFQYLIFTVILFVLAWWCGMVTSVTLDTVRGLLYGGTSLVILGAGWGWLWINYCVPWISGIPYEGEQGTVDSVFRIIGLIAWILPFAVILEMIHNRQAGGTIKWTLSVIVPFVFYTILMSISLLGLYNEGTASFVALTGSERWSTDKEIIASRVTEHGLEIIQVESEHLPMGSRFVRRVLTTDAQLWGKEAAPTTVLGATIPGKVLSSTAWICRDHALLAGSVEIAPERNYANFSKLVSLFDGSEIPTHATDAFRIEDKEAVLVSQNSDDSLELWFGPKEPWARLWPSSGLVQTATGDPTLPKLPFLEQVEGNRRYRVKESPDCLVGTTIQIEDLRYPRGQAVMGEIPFLIDAACDGDLIAGYTYSARTTGQPWWMEGRFSLTLRCWKEEMIHIESLVLFDTSDPASPKRVEINLPARVRWLSKPGGWASEHMEWLSGREGRIAFRPPPHVLLGGGYLTLWSSFIGRVAVWDIGNPQAPEFLGTAALPLWDNTPLTVGWVPRGNFFPREPTVPYVRSDGALGYLSSRGLIWLEFPSLTKPQEPTIQPSRDHQAAGEKPS